jgi:hypothetical protein
LTIPSEIWAWVCPAVTLSAVRSVTKPTRRMVDAPSTGSDRPDPSRFENAAAQHLRGHPSRLRPLNGLRNGPCRGPQDPE